MDSMDTEALAGECREEMARFRQKLAGAVGFCFELFRRALAGRDQSAWAAIYAQYAPQVRRWLGRSWAGESSDEDALVNLAFAKLWQAVPPEQFSRRFASIGPLLAFLRACARSVVVDCWRQERRERELREALGRELAVRAETDEGPALARLAREELREQVYARLRDEQEVLVVRLWLEIGLAPRQIVRRYPGQFAGVREVYRIKERVIARLRNDPQLRAWWEEWVRSGLF